MFLIYVLCIILNCWEKVNAFSAIFFCNILLALFLKKGNNIKHNVSRNVGGQYFSSLVKPTLISLPLAQQITQQQK